MLSRVNYPSFHSGKKRHFSCSTHSFLSVTLCNGASMHEYNVYWHMKFSSMLMGVASMKIMFVIILSFEAGL